jgi:hypothetical protein
MSFTQLKDWISKNTILATAIFLIFISIVGVFATEGLAPKEFKPSTIISGNKSSSSSSNPSSSLNSSQSSSSISSEAGSSSKTNSITQSSAVSSVQINKPMVAMADIIPVKVSEMRKTVNDTPYSADASGNPEICGISNIVSYYYQTDSTMTITSKLLNKNQQQLDNFQKTVDMVKTGVGYNTVDFQGNGENNGGAILDTFRDSCGGFYSYQITQKTVDYPKTDSARAIIVGEGQSGIPSISVRIFATKGDNLIMISGNLISVTQITEKCPNDSNLAKCIDNIVKNDTLAKQEIDAKIKDLLEVFAL